MEHSFFILSFSITIHHTFLLVYVLSLSSHTQSSFFFTLCSAKQDKELGLQKNVSFLESTHSLHNIFGFLLKKQIATTKGAKFTFAKLFIKMSQAMPG